MRRFVLPFALVLAVLSVSPVSAVTDGSVDGHQHPNVGGLVNGRQYSDGTWLYCSGTLISAEVFLTAAHCGRTGKDVTVTFDTDYVDGDPVYSGTLFRDPLYNHRQSDPHDIAVVVLDAPINDIEPARLPARDSLSDVPKQERFVGVGYGAYEVTNEPGGHQYLYNDVRMVASGGLKAINKSWLHISMNPALGDGGPCYGDSGGPNFLRDSDVVAATTITGDAICRATNVVYRLDTHSARSFLRGFVRLP